MHGALVFVLGELASKFGKESGRILPGLHARMPQNELGGSRRCVVQVMGDSFGLPEAGSLR